MFRKLAERLSNGVSNAANSVSNAVTGSSTASGTSSSSSSPHAQHVATLISMEFTRDQAQEALQVCHGNVDQAAEYLLNHPNQHHPNNHSTAHPNLQAVARQTEDDELQRALQASLEVTAAAAPASAPSRRIMPVVKATTVTHAKPLASHPNVQVPQLLSQKSKEEQILRCANRVKGYPNAVDTLYKAVKALQTNSNNPKFQTIDTTTAGYQNSLTNAPGALDFLLAMNYQKYGTLLKLNMTDPATIYLGVSALEQAKESEEYRSAKRLLVFDKELDIIQQGANTSTEEAIRRSEYMSKCPSEPTAGALLQIYLGGANTNTNSNTNTNTNGKNNTDQNKVIRRRFDGDDTLLDVLHWLGGHGSQIPDKILSRDWSLCDKNRSRSSVDGSLVPIPVEKYQHSTLQYIGCWPSGILALLPSTPEWKEYGTDAPSTTTTTTTAGAPGAGILSSARGLGAAHSSWMN
jgi:hypothetical protein